MLKRGITQSTLFGAVALGLFGVVLAASFLPAGSLASSRWNFGHALAYAMLTAATLLAFDRRKRSLLWLAGVVAAFSVLGLVIELLQPLFGRTASLTDFIKNEIGIMFGAIVFHIYRVSGWARMLSANKPHRFRGRPVRRP